MELRIFPYEYNIKLKGKTALKCETYHCGKVISLTGNVWITYNIKLLYTFPVLSKVKKRNKAFISKQMCIRHIFWAENTVPEGFFGGCFILDFDASTNKISIFQNPFHCVTEELPPTLQLEVI